MKVQKLFSYSNNRQIWRILLTELNQIVIEERDIFLKKVYFSCIDKNTGRTFWGDKKFLNEDYWIGIETVFRDMLFLHLFEKPDMPKHKQIIGVDLRTGEVLWVNSELTFDSLIAGSIFAYKQKFESREFFELDFQTGEILDSFGEDASRINERKQSWNNETFISTQFPFSLMEGVEFDEPRKYILNIIGDTKYVGSIEFMEYKNLLLFNYYEKVIESSLTNRLCIVDKATEKILLRETLNNFSPAPVPDSFFIDDGNLYFIKDKKEIVAISLLENQ